MESSVYCSPARLLFSIANSKQASSPHLGTVVQPQNLCLQHLANTILGCFVVPRSPGLAIPQAHDDSSGTWKLPLHAVGVPIKTLPSCVSFVYKSKYTVCASFSIYVTFHCGRGCCSVLFFHSSIYSSAQRVKREADTFKAIMDGTLNSALWWCTVSQCPKVYPMSCQKNPKALNMTKAASGVGKCITLNQSCRLILFPKSTGAGVKHSKDSHPPFWSKCCL